MKPVVSVIVPVYKVEAYLPQCLDSLAAQTFRDVEFILVNDGSPDNCGRILREYASRNANFRVIEQENRGYSGARNTGLAAATGEYIGFVDSDDWIEPRMYEMLIRLARESNADIAQCGYQYYFEQDRRSAVRDISWVARLITQSGGTLRGAEQVLFDDGCIWSKIYRRSMVRENQLRFDPTLQMAEDVPFFWKSLCLAKRISVTTEPLYHYRVQRPGQQTSFSDDRLFSFFRLFDIMDGFLQAHDLAYLDPFLLHLRLSRHCYGYEKASQEVRPEYFRRFRESLIAAGVTKKSKIAPGCLRYGGLAHRMRYLALAILHPLALRAVLDNDRKALERVIAAREFLQNLPRKLMGNGEPNTTGAVPGVSPSTKEQVKT